MLGKLEHVLVSRTKELAWEFIFRSTELLNICVLRPLFEMLGTRVMRKTDEVPVLIEFIVYLETDLKNIYNIKVYRMSKSKCTECQTWTRV